MNKLAYLAISSSLLGLSSAFAQAPVAAKPVPAVAPVAPQYAPAPSVAPHFAPVQGIAGPDTLAEYVPPELRQ